MIKRKSLKHPEEKKNTLYICKNDSKILVRNNVKDSDEPLFVKY